jgi:hypothetical protein
MLYCKMFGVTVRWWTDLCTDVVMTAWHILSVCWVVLVCHLERIEGWADRSFAPQSISPVAVVSAHRMIPDNSSSYPYRIFAIMI